MSKKDIANEGRSRGGDVARPTTRGMPKIKVGRYSVRGGTSSAPPVGRDWLGWVEPEDRSWIVFIDVAGRPVFYGQRGADGGVVEPDLGVFVNGRFTSAWGMGQDVHLSINGQRLDGTVVGVTFTDGGKVLYDVEIPMVDGAVGGATRLERVDSVFVCRDPDAGEGSQDAVVDEPPRGGDVERPWIRPLGQQLSYRRVGPLEVSQKEQWDHQEPGMPWVAHERYEMSDGTTGSRCVAYGGTREGALMRGEAVAAAYSPWDIITPSVATGCRAPSRS